MGETLMTVVLITGLGLFLTLAYVGERREVVGWLVLLTLFVADLFAMLIGGLIYVSGSLLEGAGPEVDELLEEAGAAGGDVAAALPPVGLLLVALGVIGLILLIPQVRSLLARLIPIDASRLVHTVALQYSLILVLVSGLTAAIVTVLLEDPDMINILQESIESSGLVGLWGQNLGFVVLGALGVGLFVVRGPRETLERLGLTARIDWRWWLGGTAFALVAAFATDFLWQRLAPEGFEDVGRLSEALIEPIFGYGILGALTIGLAAGIGEEILFRGAAQPRFGIVFTAALFAVLHTQYSISPALLLIFALGVVLGLTRVRSNTTTAIAVHATYNFTIAMFALYGGS